MELHERIRQARVDQGMTQHSLALAVGVSLRTPNRWESGASRPRSSQIPALAAALGKDVAYFEADDAEADRVRVREEVAALFMDRLMSALSCAAVDDSWNGVDRRHHQATRIA